MKCPVCGDKDSRVLDSRPLNDYTSIKRRRECPKCGKRFTTYEFVEMLPIMVVKKDGVRKEPFDRHKLQAGIMKACQKRPVDAEKIAMDIENELQSSLENEISTERIGEMVMERLRGIDDVSYVRFASVYREFKDVDTFLSELKTLIKGKKKK